MESALLDAVAEVFMHPCCGREQVHDWHYLGEGVWFCLAGGEIVTGVKR